MQILNETSTRREYKTKWQAIARAQAVGVNMRLVDALYAELLRRGYTKEFARAAVFDAARCGAFGFVNAWER